MSVLLLLRDALCHLALQNVQRLAMLCQFMSASLQSPGPLFEANWQGKAQGANWQRSLQGQ